MTCTALRVLKLLARGERAPAEEILTQDLALPETSRERMMPGSSSSEAWPSISTTVPPHALRLRPRGCSSLWERVSTTA